MEQPSMDAAGWCRRFAETLGVAPPTDEEVESLLALAGVAAHAAERTAAPLSCWLVGRAGLAPAEALAAARGLAGSLEAPPGP